MTTDPSCAEPVLVWDAPVRVFHWLLVLSFAGAHVTAESERLRLLHVTLGYTLGGLIVFRLLWGLVGTRHARFAHFVRGPRAAWHYVRSLASEHPEHHSGHNPAGALAIVAMLGLGMLTALSGWARYEQIGGEWLEELHEGAAHAMLVLALVHLAGVLIGSIVHQENLVRTMISGKRTVPALDRIRRAWRPLAVLMVLAVLGFWWQQWSQAPADRRPAISQPATSGVHARDAKTEHHQEIDD